MRLTDCYIDACIYTLYLLRGDSHDVQSYDAARDKVETLLSRAEQTARSRGFSQDDIENAKFAVCAWIDETVLTSQWSEAPEWKKQQLQRVFFNTNNAGVDFFLRLEDLGKNRTAVREVYVLCLCLGFHGRHFHEDDRDTLAAVRSDNLGMLLGDLAHEKDLAGAKIFPEAYWKQGKLTARGGRFRPFDWISFLIPVVALLIAVELYFFYNNSLNIQLLEFFGTLQ